MDSSRPLSAEQYVGFAIGHSPDILYEKLDSPKLVNLPEDVSLFVATQLQDSLENKNSQILHAGISDTQRILFSSLREQTTPLLEEEVLAIVRSEQTLATLSKLALFPQSSLHYALSGQRSSRYFGLNPKATGIMIRDDLPQGSSSHGGCPHAGNNERGLPTPLFNNFVVWAGSLSTKAYFSHVKWPNI